MEHSQRELASLEGEHRLTEMELAGLKHALDSELLGLKKCLVYAEQSRDGQARELYREHADIHHRRIDMMLALLEATGDVTKEAKLLLQRTGPGEGYGHA